jgi:hypothetical protein
MENENSVKKGMKRTEFFFRRMQIIPHFVAENCIQEPKKPPRKSAGALTTE